MAAPLTLLLILAVTIRAVLFRSSLAAIISERVEVVSPLNAWKRGRSFIDDLCSEPLLLCLALACSASVMTVQVAGQTAFYDKLIVIKLELVAYQSPLALLPPTVKFGSNVTNPNTDYERAFMHCVIVPSYCVNASLCVSPASPCQISPPNIGLFWYFFAEMFEHFRLFFICVFQINVFFDTIPLSIKLKEHPVFLIFMQIAVISIFKSYPTVGNIALYMAFLPAWNHLYRFLRNIVLVSVVLLACSALFPVLWHLWIYTGSANSNFYYSITLLFNVAQVSGLEWAAQLGRLHHLTHGLYLKRKDCSEATLVLK
uniref:Phosphatidylinositol glycan anchor biosynthesis, class U n=1 Tax=Hucho hucho TaxID=62062 RepID=A0A4W5K7M3_9TELE